MRQIQARQELRKPRIGLERSEGRADIDERQVVVMLEYCFVEEGEAAVSITERGMDVGKTDGADVSVA